MVDFWRFALWACSSKGRIVILGRNISSWGRKSHLKICPEAETIRPKMTIRPLDEQALKVWQNTLDLLNNAYYCLAKQLRWVQCGSNHVLFFKHHLYRPWTFLKTWGVLFMFLEHNGIQSESTHYAFRKEKECSILFLKLCLSILLPENSHLVPEHEIASFDTR